MLRNLPLSITYHVEGHTRYERGRESIYVTDSKDQGWFVRGAQIERLWSFQERGRSGMSKWRSLSGCFNFDTEDELQNDLE